MVQAHYIWNALRQARWVTRDRTMLWGIFFSLMSLLALATHVVTHTTMGITDIAGDHLANDFINYWAGARLAADGEAASAYHQHDFYAFEQTVAGPNSAFKIYVYPPIAMLLSLPFAALPFVSALCIWTAAGLGICFAVLSQLLRWQEALVAVIGALQLFLTSSVARTGISPQGCLPAV